MPGLSASDIILRNQGRTRAVYEIFRKRAAAAKINTTAPVSNITMKSSSGTDYTNGYLPIVQGQQFLTADDLAILFPTGSTPAPPTPPPPPFNTTYSFLVVANVDDEQYPNFMYRVFNATTSEWSDLIDSGVLRTDSSLFIDGTSNYNDNDFFYVIYLNENDNDNRKFAFIDGSGVTTRTIDVPDSDFSYYSGTKLMFIKTNNGSGTFTFNLYRPDGDILRTSTLTFDGYINDVLFMNNAVYFIMFDNLTGKNRHYIWKIMESTYTFLFETFGYDSEQKENNSNVFIVAKTLNTNFYDTIKFITESGTVQTYNLTPNVYTGSSETYFGINNSHFFARLSNSLTNFRDFYIFKIGASLNPIIKTGVNSTANYNYENSNGDYQTVESNNFAIIDKIPIMNYIGDGGGDMFDDGNYISIIVNNGTSDVYNIDEGEYGESAQSGQYGYLIGSPNVYPHMSMACVGSGANTVTLRASGNVGTDGSGEVDNYPEIGDPPLEYGPTTSGRRGKFWMTVNYGRSDPSIGDLWFTVERDSWSSLTALADDQRKPDDDNNYNTYITLTGQNFIFCKALLSRTSAQYIDESDVRNFLEAYVDAADFGTGISDTFANISVATFKDWHIANGGTYKTQIPDWYNYNYDGGDVPDFGFGSIYTYIDGATQFVTTLDNSSLKFGDVRVNNNGCALISFDTLTNKFLLNFYSSSPSVASVYLASFTVTLADLNYYNFNSFQNNIYICFVLNDNTSQYAVVQNDTIIRLEVTGDLNEPDVAVSKSNAIVINPDTGLTTLLNPVSPQLETTNTYVSAASGYPDFATGFVYAFVPNGNDVLILTDTAKYEITSTETIEGERIILNDHIVFASWSGSGVKILAFYANDENVYSSYTNTNNTDLDNIWNTDTQIWFIFNNNDTSTKYYVVFNTITHEFSEQFDEPFPFNSNYKLANYPFQPYD